MVFIKSGIHTKNVGDRKKNQELKLKLPNYINWLIFIIFLYVFFLFFWEDIKGEKLNNVYYYSIIILPIIIILRINILSIIKTDITSIELIGFYFFEIASKLDKNIRDTNKKIISNKLIKIQNELNLINFFYNNYHPERVRKSEAPLLRENQEFIHNLEKVLRKLSSTIKHDMNLSYQIELDLNLLAEELCKNPPKITETMKKLLLDIFNDLNHVSEDKHFAEPHIKKITTAISVKIKSNYFIRVLISIIVLILAFFILLQINIEIRNLIIITITTAIITAIITKFLK